VSRKQRTSNSRFSPAEARDQCVHVGGQRRFEPHLAAIDRMTKGQQARMQRLASETRIVRSESGP